jgi:tRNA threonylcarbamoyladenosine biosynthesis protein TsaB
MPSPLILALDTATASCGVALTAGTANAGRVLGTLSLNGPGGCSRRVLKAIEYLLDEAGVGWSDIEGIGVSLGPGSFTGLRIGMAIAKGLAMATGVSLHGVSTLDTLAMGCPSEGLVCALLDARRQEVYGAFYRNSGRGVLKRLSEPRAWSPVACAEAIAEPAVLVGDGAVLYAELFSARLGSHFQLAPTPLHQPSPAWLGLLAAEQLRQGVALDLATAVPLYIRRADAALPRKSPPLPLAAER